MYDDISDSGAELYFDAIDQNVTIGSNASAIGCNEFKESRKV
jgi:hypothetical protein